ncbi:MAG TPA: phage baseplate protein [Blastocatellia bacterium]|nr:phage baseplate protein [Blastocatellia bacterium]
MTTQALMLLATASPDRPHEELEKLSIGRRDAQLLTLREVLFGSKLTGLTACPECGRQLELGFEATELRVGAGQPPPETLTIRNGGYLVEFRLPNSEDLAALTEPGRAECDAAGLTGRLLLRCLVQVRHNGKRQNLDSSRTLPPAVLDAVAAEMEKADPQANVQLELNCADCGHRWLSAFDIVSFLWNEIDNWARRLLSDVCLLASTFGWRESDILAMSVQRRQLYLQIIGAVT